MTIQNIRCSKETARWYRKSTLSTGANFIGTSVSGVPAPCSDSRNVMAGQELMLSFDRSDLVVLLLCAHSMTRLARAAHAKRHIAANSMRITL